MRIIKAADLGKNFFRYQDLEEIALVKEIIRDVRQNGDEAIKKYTLKYDGLSLKEIKVNHSEIDDACHTVDSKIVSSLKQAAENIKKFAARQLDNFQDFELEIAPGVFAGQKIMPIERVGIYVPGGRFPLASSVLMCALPAKMAGVKEIVMCSPPSPNGSIQKTTLVAAHIAGVSEIYKVGGAQAIAAMAFGTRTIRKVEKIVGPGNKYVTYAKKEVFGEVGIDFIAGPTEIMIIADESSNPELVSADLLAQAEHDLDAKPFLLTTSIQIAERVRREVEFQLPKLDTENIAKISILQNGTIILVSNLEEAIQIANRRAPEHIELHVRNPDPFIARLRNYGSLFIGEYAAEALADYCSGLNHTLPTNTTARYSGGLSVMNFLKLQTSLRVEQEGFSILAPIAQTLARAEGLDGHAKSIAARMK